MSAPNRIDAAFARLKEKKQKAFIPYIAAGVPGTEETVQIALALEALGADVLELGYPFSDPMADGVVNQLAATRALENGVDGEAYLAMVKAIRAKSQIPILVFSYLNPVYRQGLREFAAKAKQAGADGFLLVDLPVEEAGEMVAICRELDLRFIFLAAPTTTPPRLARILELGSGFLYYISRTGITGEREGFQEDFAARLGEIRAAAKLPVVAGFGISTPDQVATACALCDGVVVGSALVRRTLEPKPFPEILADLRAVAEPLAAAAKGRLARPGKGAA
jgi:tryptophan synthase alpha chain